MESEILNKYVTIFPSVSQVYNLSRVQVLYVVSETAKQIKAAESPNSRLQTFSKSDVGRVVDEQNVKKIRINAMNMQNEYRTKRKELLDEYLDKSIGLV